MSHGAAKLVGALHEQLVGAKAVVRRRSSEGRVWSNVWSGRA